MPKLAHILSIAAFIVAVASLAAPADEDAVPPETPEIELDARTLAVYEKAKADIMFEYGQWWWVPEFDFSYPSSRGGAPFPAETEKEITSRYLEGLNAEKAEMERRIAKAKGEYKKRYGKKLADIEAKITAKRTAIDALIADYRVAWAKALPQLAEGEFGYIDGAEAGKILSDKAAFVHGAFVKRAFTGSFTGGEGKSDPALTESVLYYEGEILLTGFPTEGFTQGEEFERRLELAIVATTDDPYLAFLAFPVDYIKKGISKKWFAQFVKEGRGLLSAEQFLKLLEQGKLRADVSGADSTWMMPKASGDLPIVNSGGEEVYAFAYIGYNVEAVWLRLAARRYSDEPISVDEIVYTIDGEKVEIPLTNENAVRGEDSEGFDAELQDELIRRIAKAKKVSVALVGKETLEWELPPRHIEDFKAIVEFFDYLAGK